MYVAAVLLRRAGERLRAGDLAPPLHGDLRIGGTDPGSFKRPVYSAQLWAATYSQYDRPIGLPLFDPRLVFMDGTTFSLVGIELNSRDGRISEHVQVWRCTVMNGGAMPTMPPKP